MANPDFLGYIASILGLIQFFYRFNGARHEIETDQNIHDRISTFLLRLSQDPGTQTGCLSHRRKQLVDADIRHLGLLLGDVKNAVGEKEVNGLAKRLLRGWEWVFRNKEVAQMSKDAVLHGHLMLLTNMILAILEIISPCCEDVLPLELEASRYSQLGRLRGADRHLKKSGWPTVASPSVWLQNQA